MDKPKFYTSRSAANLYAKCSKARYLQYHHLGTGIVKDQIYLPFAVGGAIHKGLEVMLNIISGTESNQTGLLERETCPDAFAKGVVEPSCAAAREAFMAEVSKMPYDMSELELMASGSEKADSAYSNIPSMAGAKDPVAEAILYTTNEQACLVEALVASFAYAENGLKRLVAEYEILEVEQEDSFVLDNNDSFDLIWESRADGLLRRRMDNALIVLSFKTAANYDQRKSDVAISDTQGMSEVVAIQKRLNAWRSLAYEGGRFNYSAFPKWFDDTGSKWGNGTPQIEGVQMIYLIKGSQRKDTDGTRKQDNNLIRPWIKMDDLSGEDDFKFSDKILNPANKSGYGKLPSSYKRTNLWEEATRYGCSIWQLVQAFCAETDPVTGATIADQFVVFPSVVRREPERLQLWEDEMKVQEGKIAAAVLTIRTQSDIEQLDNSVKVATFPHTGSATGACAYWNAGGQISKCPYFSCCWESRYYADDPLHSGFKYRESNHPGEKESLQSMLVNIIRKD